MTEQCYRCGRTWGVTMTPRTWVLCTPCARPAPNWGDVAYYWRSRARTASSTAWRLLHYRSPEWWDQQTAVADLGYAAEIAADNLRIPAGVVWGDSGGKRPEWLDAPLPAHVTAHTAPPGA